MCTYALIRPFLRVTIPYLPIPQPFGQLLAHARVGSTHDDSIHQHEDDEELLHSLIVELVPLPLEGCQGLLCLNVLEADLVGATLLLVQHDGGLLLLPTAHFAGRVTSEVSKGLDDHH